MALSSELVSQFAKIMNDDNKDKNEKTVFGTIVDYNGSKYVKLDGSDLLTPISSTANANDGERVTVMIKNHKAIVNGNMSSPSARQGDLDEISDQISEFEIIIADKVDTIELDAERARIDELFAKNVTIDGKLDANEADIKELKAHNVTIDGKLEANEAEIENLKTKKLDADIADIKYATIENLEAINIDVRNLEADYGDFKDLATDKFTAIDADIKNLDTEKLSAEEADLKYANIDFANIGKAAIENFFSKSGMIGDLIVGDGTITGTLVGVTIKGDLIEGGTVVADKLVVKGTDGLYYKLNTDGETVGSEQTDYNSLNGKIITAKSITAEKVNVHDLVAFDATIGGFKITESSIYSGVKETADNTTRGIYLDDEGQVSFGDETNYLRYFRTEDGQYKLELSAESLVFSSSNKTVEEIIDDKISTIEVDSSTDGNLVKNGFGDHLDATNFNGAIFVRDDAPDGSYGYFTKDPESELYPNTSAISFDKTSVYVYSYNCRLREGQTGNAYFSINPIDVDGKRIDHGHVLNFNQNLFYLSQDLNDGDTVVHFTDLSEWRTDTTADHQRSFLFFGYTDGTGYTYPDGTYSRKIYTKVYTDDTAVDKENNTITLISEWSGGMVESGTCVAQTSDGNTYCYYGQKGEITNTEWQKWTGKFSANNEDVNGRRLLYAKDIQVVLFSPVADWAGIFLAKEVVDDTARDTANNAQDIAEANNDRISKAESSITQLADSISMLVTDGEGNSLMEQTSDGWRFNMSVFQDTLDEAIDNINDINGSIDQVDQTVENLKSLANDLSAKTAYIVMTTDDTGAPCIELGKEGNDFKLRITNTSVDFMQGTSRIAYISNKALYIETAIVKNELKIGDGDGFIWRTRENGNMGLRWEVG